MSKATTPQVNAVVNPCVDLPWSDSASRDIEVRFDISREQRRDSGGNSRVTYALTLFAKARGQETVMTKKVRTWVAARDFIVTSGYFGLRLPEVSTVALTTTHNGIASDYYKTQIALLSSWISVRCAG